MTIGDCVIFALEPEIEAMIINIHTSSEGIQYQVSWFDNNGLRIAEYVKPCEIKAKQ